MTNPNRPSHREAMRDEAAKTRSLRQCSTSNEHLDKAVSWYLNVGFQDGADWQYEQDKARIEKLEKEIGNLKMVCIRLSRAKTIEKRDSIADKCRHLFIDLFSICRVKEDE